MRDHKLFLYFLKQNNIVEEYKHNFRHANSGNMLSWLENNLYNDFLYEVFTWEETEEGYWFWAGVQNKWFSFRTDLIIKLKFKIKYSNLKDER